jgi:hypothetical protein
MNQREWLDLLHEKTKHSIQVLEDPAKQYKQYAVPLENATSKNIFGRLKLSGELFFDFEIKGDDHARLPTKEEWRTLKEEINKLTALLEIKGIPYIYANSGKGIHVHIFTDIKNEYLEQIFYKWLIKQAALNDHYLDSQIMLSRQIADKRLRCFGSKNTKIHAFKSHSFEICTEFDGVEYPNSVAVYCMSKTILSALYKIYDEEKKREEHKATTKENIELGDCALINYGINNKLPVGKRGYVFSKNLMGLGPTPEQIEAYCSNQEDQDINPSSVEGWSNYAFNCFEMQKYAKEFDLFDRTCKDCPYLNNITKDDIQKAIDLSKDPLLLYKIKKELDKVIVGEDTLKLAIVLAGASIKCNSKLSIQVTGESSAGKTKVVKEALKLFPEDNVKNVTRISKRALDYFEKENLDDKILYVGEGAGAEEAIETIKMITDPISHVRESLIVEKTQSGQQELRTLKTKGTPVFITTTAKVIDDIEFTNRLLTVGVNLTQAQTENVVKFILNSEADLKYSKQDEEFRKTFQLMFEQFLKKVDVKILFAPPIYNLFTQYVYKTRLRRDIQKFLALIKASAILYQAQRPIVNVNNKPVILAMPQDFWNALIIGQGFLLTTMENLHETSNKIKQIILENSDDLMKEYPIKERKDDVEFCNGFTVNDFRELRKIDLKRDTIYQHLEILVDIGFLHSFKSGRSNVYTVLDSELNSDKLRLIDNGNLIASDMEMELKNSSDPSRIGSEPYVEKFFLEGGKNFKKYINPLTGIEISLDIDKNTCLSSEISIRDETKAITSSISDTEDAKSLFRPDKSSSELTSEKKPKLSLDDVL